MRGAEPTLRRLATAADYAAAVELQREAWGGEFREIVPPSVLMTAQKVGGVTAGAFDGDGRLLGFVFGLTGLADGRLAHWSQMLAVRDAARGTGVGERLKLFQRQLLLPLGVEVARWTYDPLEAKNAHLNLGKLGARVLSYELDTYGAESGSKLHRGIGTDRFVVEWNLAAPLPPAPPAIDPEAAEAAPVVNETVNGAAPPAAPVVRVEIPADIQTLKDADPEAGRRWRRATRRAFLHYLERGYRVAAFTGGAGRRCFYLLCSPSAA